jgi:hypothetical protein
MVVGIEKLHSGRVAGNAEVILASNSAGNRLNWRQIAIALITGFPGMKTRTKDFSSRNNPQPIVTSDLAPEIERADHSQGGSGRREARGQ